MEETQENNKLDAFRDVTTKEMLASVLGVSHKVFVYNLYKVKPEDKYSTFEISKRNGGKRKICAPISGIKYIQRNLADILNEIYVQKYCVHGYVKGKSIKTNAQVHAKKRIIINTDLSDFFPSINFGRVRGIFKAFPFNFNDEIATTLAQICCHDGVLPQGAPSSPIISNFICRKMDNELLSLSTRYKVTYSRYADDLTFSTNLAGLPKEIGRIKNNKLILSRKLRGIIKSNDFKVNTDKTRYALRNNRQDVTGLIVNSGVNVSWKLVRQVRSMLHAWEKFDLPAAAAEHFEKYARKGSKPTYPDITFKNILVGKIGYIGYIKGKGNPVYQRLYSRIKKLDSTVRLSIANAPVTSNLPTVFCEGKTDGIHLQSALDYFRRKGEFVDLDIAIFKYKDEHEVNNELLLKACQVRPQTKRSQRIEIFLFDRDVPRYCKEASENGNLYKDWGNNVYSALLPEPPHRFPEVCIEFFYTDDILYASDEKGRRLYTSNEFDSASGHHLKEPHLIYVNRNYLKAPFKRILDSKVSKENGDNVALSKKTFADNIANQNGNFKDVSFEHFKPIFEIFKEIISVGSSLT